MTPEHLSALLQVAATTTDAEGWEHTADGRSMTLHLAHDGASVTISRICAIRSEAKLVFLKSNQGEQYVVARDDLFAGSVEGPKDLGRKAGFV
jgi:hypothetical protein